MNTKLISVFIISMFIYLGFFTYTYSNTWMLITDTNNYIPKESNTFQFSPIQIDEGSGGYWRYGKDIQNYYYFSETEENIYHKISINNNCINFNPTNFQTWCNSTIVKNLK